jgi:hypothetical protein
MCSENGWGRILQEQRLAYNGTNCSKQDIFAQPGDNSFKVSGPPMCWGLYQPGPTHVNIADFGGSV